MVRFYIRLTGWIVAIVIAAYSLTFSLEAYAVTLLALVGTLFWVFGSNRMLERAESGPTLVRLLRKACYSDDVFGGGLVGLSVFIQGISQIMTDAMK